MTEPIIKPFDVLIVGGLPEGGGGRDHMFAWLCQKSPLVRKVYCWTQNTGIIGLSKVERPQEDPPKSLEELALWAKAHNIGLTIPGPEALFAAGIVDIFQAHGLAIFGPTAAAAMIEASKLFGKEVMREAGVPTAAYMTFTDSRAAREYVESAQYPLVVKCDELAAGKGVVVCSTVNEAINAIKAFMEDGAIKGAGKTILIEEYLTPKKGVRRPEVSVFALVDTFGNFQILGDAHDWKRRFNRDEGPNTGGMASCSPAFNDHPRGLLAEVGEKFIKPIVDELIQRMKPFSGILYAGLMLTKDGYKVVEYNCRIGDPEGQALAVRWRTDIIALMKKVADGGSIECDTVSFNDTQSLCVVVCDTEYPAKNYPRPIPSALLGSSDTVQVFCAGTKAGPGESVISNGGRVLNIVGMGADWEEAGDEALTRIANRLPDNLPGLDYRFDMLRRP